MTQADFPDTPGTPSEVSSDVPSPKTPTQVSDAAPAGAVSGGAVAAGISSEMPPPERPAGTPGSGAPQMPSAESVPASAEELAADAAAQEAAMDSSFGDILSEFEDAQSSDGGTMEGTVVSVTPEAIFVDVGRKTDGVLPGDPDTKLQPGDKITVSIRGRDGEGNLTLSTIRVEAPTDWSGLEAAFANKNTIAGTVVAAVKGGLRVDVGVPAFMPASRSGVREMAAMEKLVGESIECRITKLDTAKNDVVVDRRVVLEERSKAEREEAFARLEPGTIVKGTVRTLTDFGAFVDLGGVDGLLHVSDMSYARGVKPSEVVSVDQEIEVKILKLDPGKRKISLGFKQLQPDPWTVAAEKYTPGSKIAGKVVRIADFGAFVEVEPGLDGLVHVSEMSWTNRNVKPGDIVKVGDQVEVMVLTVDPAKKRIGLGLKQALGDPWADAMQKFPVGSVAEAPVTSLAQFGAFVDLGDGIEGMIHIGDITNEKRLNHPNEMLKVGQVVKAKVTEADKARRRMRLSMKQLEPTSADEYVADHKVGDVVTGRVASISKGRMKVDLDEGVSGQAPMPDKKEAAATGGGQVDLSALTAMLSDKWKSGGGAESETESIRTGQVRNFKITALDAESRRIDLELEA